MLMCNSPGVCQAFKILCNMSSELPHIVVGSVPTRRGGARCVRVESVGPAVFQSSVLAGAPGFFGGEAICGFDHLL